MTLAPDGRGRSDAGKADNVRPWSLVGPDGNALVGDVDGPRDGPPVILLHGGGQSRSSWRIAAEWLADTGYCVLTPDLRGHGESDWSPNGDYGIEPFVADLLVEIGAMGAPVVLVGASFGGHVSLVLAARYPSLVHSLVLCDVTPWIEGEATRAMRAIMAAAARGFATVTDAARHLELMGGASPGPDVERLARHMRRGGNGRFYWRWDPQFFLHHQLPGEHNSALLVAAASKLIMPTLLIRAGQSEIVDQQQTARFRQLVPHAVFAEIEGARHTVSGKDNPAYASIILRFLDQMATADGIAKRDTRWIGMRRKLSDVPRFD